MSERDDAGPDEHPGGVTAASSSGNEPPDDDSGFETLELLKRGLGQDIPGWPEEKQREWYRAWQQVMEDHERLLSHIYRRTCPDRNDPDGFQNEVWSRVARSIGRCRSLGDLKGLMTTIATNLCRSAGRRREVETAHSAWVLGEAREWMASGEGTEMPSLDTWDGERDLLTHALALLTPAHAQIFHHKFILGKTNAETAEDLGYSAASIPAISSRILRQLREALHDKYGAD